MAALRAGQPRRLRTALGTLAVLLPATIALTAIPGPAVSAVTTAAEPAAARPNVVFVLVDDGDEKTLDYMPLTTALIGDAGATFENFIFNQALCCPSRATILRGQYSQNTGVTGNKPPAGGYSAFYHNGNEASTLGTWFDDADYRTGYLGKYFNGYAQQAGLPNTHVPVGWDHWFGLFEDSHDSYNYTVNEDGVITTRGDKPKDYVTDVLARDARDFIRADDGSQPFLMMVSTKAPHGDATPADRHRGLFADVDYPRGPAFNEADVSDKPAPISDLPPLTDEQIAKIDRDYRRRLRSVQAVDEMVAELVETLREQGELNNTYFMFASDNGFHMGEHRIPSGKNMPYEEDIRVPMLLRGPGITPGLEVSGIVGNVDIAPTLAGLAGVDIPSFVDGRSFEPLLDGGSDPWRSSYLTSRGGRLAYAGVRTDRYLYLEYARGDGEFYDLRTDPYQLTNTYSSMNRQLKASLHQHVVALRDCAGQACRDAEMVPLVAQGG